MMNLAESGFEAPEDSGEWVIKIFAVEECESQGATIAKNSSLEHSTSSVSDVWDGKDMLFG